MTLNDLQADEPRAITDGPFGSNLTSSHYTSSGPRVVRLQNIGDGKFVDAHAHISQDHFDSLRGHEVRAGDLLVASLGEVLPRACLAPTGLGPAIVKADCIRVRLDPGVDPRWVLYSLQRPFIRRWADDHRHGVGRPRLGLKMIRQIPVPLPGIAEQRRIVAILEDHLSRLNVALEGVSRAVDRVRALTTALISRELAVAGGVPHLLGQVASVKNGIFVSRASSIPDGVPILRIGSVRALELKLYDLRYSKLSQSELRSVDALLAVGDLMFTRYNGNPRFVGASAVVPGGAPVLTYPDKLIRVRVDRTKAVPEFLELACNHGSPWKQIQDSVKTTSGQAGISGRDLKAVQLLLPDLAVQKEVSNRTMEHMETANRMLRELDRASQRGLGLQRSLLTAAFSGRLTGHMSDLDRAEEVASHAGAGHP